MVAGREVIARKGVHSAMGRELQSVILEAKSKAGQFKSLPAFGSWNRTSLSVGRDRPHARLSLLGLPLVLANLLSSGRLLEDELHGFRDVKPDCIKRAAK